MNIIPRANAVVEINILTKLNFTELPDRRPNPPRPALADAISDAVHSSSDGGLNKTSSNVAATTTVTKDAA